MKITSLYLAIIAVLLLGSCAKNEEPKPAEEEPITTLAFTDWLGLLENTELTDRPALVESFYDTLIAPVITDSNTVYFVYIKDGINSISVTGDFTGWNSGYELTNVEGTGFWYKKLEFEANARLDYKFIVNGSNWIIDPKNPFLITGGFGPNSELAMPSYVQPWEIEPQSGALQGIIHTHELSSTYTGKTYPIKVYTPPAYDADRRYPVAYFQDGGEYLSLANVADVLDNLIRTEAITPVIAVFVTPTNRNEEYAGSIRFKYCDFYVKELVPYIDGLYATIPEPAKRAVIGDSYGGNISAIISFSNSDVFGNCGLHSGAFQTYNFATNSLVTDGVKKDIRVASIWGSYEFGLFDNMRYIRDYLIDMHYDITWKELPEGHSWGLWRATTDDMLIFFFPSE